MTAPELISPEHLTPAERARVIATILALALIRTHADERCSERPSNLGFSPRKSVHRTCLNTGA
jgi:hypothetical protein